MVDDQAHQPVEHGSDVRLREPSQGQGRRHCLQRKEHNPRIKHHVQLGLHPGSNDFLPTVLVPHLDDDLPAQLVVQRQLAADRVLVVHFNPDVHLLPVRLRVTTVEVMDHQHALDHYCALDRHRADLDRSVHRAAG